MNILAFVISLLLILSYSFFIIFEKQNSSHKIRSSFMGHAHANRKILRSYENALYNTFAQKSKPLKPPKKATVQKNQKPKKEKPKQNRECARLNVSSLIQFDIEEHRLLYDLTAKLFSKFYGKDLFEDKPKSEYKFLNAWLKIAKKKPDLPIEKYEFKDPELKEIYYRMLKGSKNHYPSLLDYITTEPQKEATLCLYHAHPNLIALLFGEKAAPKIYDEMHKADALPVTQEVIERLCSEVHTPIFETEIFKLLTLGRPHHTHPSKRTIIETDWETAITLRKEVHTSRS